MTIEQRAIEPSPLLVERDTAATSFALQVQTSVPVPVRPHTGAAHVEARMVSFTPVLDGREHVAALIGDWSGNSAPLVRVHSECLTGDVFGSARCDCGPQLDEALRLMADEGGIVLYLRQEGRGIGLYNKLDAYRLQDEGLDTYEANRALHLEEDARDFSVAAAMLMALGVTRCRLLSNNPDKAEQLRACGIDIVEQRPTGVFLTAVNRRYLEAKVSRGRHTIRIPHAPRRAGHPEAEEPVGTAGPAAVAQEEP